MFENLGRGNHIRTQNVPFSPTWKGKDHKEIGFMQVREDNAKDCHQHGYINIELNNRSPPPIPMTENECECHVVGLTLANMYNLRKGTELFGERADESVMKN